MKTKNQERVKRPLDTIVMWLRKKAKARFELYDIKDLQIGGHCGCCGEPIPDEIFDKNWSWGLCKKCRAT